MIKEQKVLSFMECDDCNNPIMDRFYKITTTIAPGNFGLDPAVKIKRICFNCLQKQYPNTNEATEQPDLFNGS